MKTNVCLWQEVLKKNIWNVATIFIVAGLVAYLSWIPQIDLDLIKILLTIGATIFSITTATLVFYSRYVEESITWLFDKKEMLKEKYPEIIQGIGKRYLRLIFLHWLLVITLTLIGVSIFTSALIVFLNLPLSLGRISLCLLLVGIGTLILWMIIFGFSTMPGKVTYEALMKEK